MKLSIFTTVTDPKRRGDNYSDALACYKDLADEVVVVNGGQQITNHLGIKYVNYKWPEKFNWEFIGQQFQRGYNACTGDWVIHADIDFIFHENHFKEIREACERDPHATGLGFHKYQLILPDRYKFKSRLVLAVNKAKYGNRIKFDSGGDFCQPSLDGEYINPAYAPDTNIPFWNYEKILKTYEQVVDDVERMDDAYLNTFGETLYSNDELTAYEGWLKMALGRFNKAQHLIPLEAHPKYMQDTIRNLTPDQFGYNAFGKLERNSYAQNRSSHG